MRAPVATVRVAGTGSLPSGVIEAGEIAQVEPAGTPEQPSVTLALNPNVGVTVTAKVVAWPAVMLVEGGETESTKSEPFPLRLITCGLAGALSVMVIEPVLAPDPEGRERDANGAIGLDGESRAARIGLCEVAAGHDVGYA